MPIPNPNPGEEQKAFISRCAGILNEEFPDNTQRIAVCYSQWRKSKKKDSIDTINRTFVFNIDYSKESNLRIDETTGFLHAKARLTRAGVFDYYDEEGNLLREYRSDDEVFDNESIRSLELKPITNDHPLDEMVTSENIKELQVGTIGEKIEKDGIYLTSNIVITDKSMVETVINRKKSGLNTELSCGYSCKLIPNIGIHKTDGYYTFEQKKIRYNHVGIVDKGRAGRDVRILDKDNNNKKELNKMGNKVQFKRKAINLDSLKLDAITIVVDEDNLGTLDILSDKLDEATTVITSIKKDKDVLQGKFDQANETIETLKKRIDSLLDINSPEIIQMMKVRSDVETVCKALGVSIEGKDIKTCKCDCIKSVSENVDLTDKSDDYIDARYDSVRDIIKDREKNEGNNRFNNFMKNADKAKSGEIKDPRQGFINKDKEQNRK